ncbi:MAG: GspE/PulE family protein [Candidatus Omnitrophica bacterium]|nr:GspE/PulE family protein [Candidatus Omnitrophota bacterium]
MESLKQRISKYLIDYRREKKEVIRDLEKKSSNFKEFKEELIKNNIVSEEELLIIFSREYKIPYLDLDKYHLPKENKELLPQDLAFRYKVVPISRIGDVLTIATSNPLDIVVIDELYLATSFKRICPVLCKEEKINKFLNNLYVIKEEKEQNLKEDIFSKVTVKEQSFDESIGIETLVKESKLPPIVRIVDLIIYEGIKRRASDIHIEPTSSDVSVRYRIDGVLQHGLSLPKVNQDAVIARLKIMSSLNITEFRIPQDGRFKVKFEGKTIDFRVSSLPTNFGEKIVLRILDSSNLSSGIDKLGFSEKPLKLFEKALSSPFGIILVTGPTGSGKSTTLYSIISKFNNPQKNIITIEDPVEYQLDGITQIQVKPDIGLTFAHCLRSVLRQSPDIVMVGEIRDAETADIAIKASLTGEFIFSTLHTNSSVGAITRLIDMGIEPFLVASSIIATTAQRLVRKLCLKCRVKDDIEENVLERLGFKPITRELFRPRGCPSCNYTGYYGRLALLEVLLFDDIIREMIIKRASEDDIVDYARKERGFISLKEDGFDKCCQGITSLEEVLRVAG